MNEFLQRMESEADKYSFEQLKTTIALTSGTLIVSLSVIDIKILLYKGVLYVSWLFLINAIIFGISAFTAGINRYRRTAKGLKGKLNGKEKELYDKGKILTPVEAKTLGIHIWSFTIGFISFFIFIFLNIHAIMKW